MPLAEINQIHVVSKCSSVPDVGRIKCSTNQSKENGRTNQKLLKEKLIEIITFHSNVKHSFNSLSYFNYAFVTLLLNKVDCVCTKSSHFLILFPTWIILVEFYETIR